MQINSLKLENVRTFERAEFVFHPGMNLIIGVNGSGKSTILNSLRAILSRGLPRFSQSPDDNYFGFDSDDIRSGQDSLIASVSVYTSDTPIWCQVKYAGTRNSLSLKPSHSKIISAIKNNDEQPLCVYFSTRRSLPVQKTHKTREDLGEQKIAFLDALDHRELRIQELASWWLAQSKLAEEGYQNAHQRIKTQQEALSVFLDGCSNLQAVSEPQPTLLIEKDNAVLDVRSLSDGERSVLALVLDLARRLSQANPELDNPLTEGKAVVLIDEIDLHLHPRWQRTIVKKLTDTFPSCQFIATTHSPLIIGEVDPKGLTLISRENSQISITQGGLQSFGLDSSWILKHIMGASPRNIGTLDAIESIEDALEDGDLDLARERLANYRSIIYGNDGEAMRLEASINNLEAFADEMDTEDE